MVAAVADEGELHGHGGGVLFCAKIARLARFIHQGEGNEAKYTFHISRHLHCQFGKKWNRKFYTPCDGSGWTSRPTAS